MTIYDILEVKAQGLLTSSFTPFKIRNTASRGKVNWIFVMETQHWRGEEELYIYILVVGWYRLRWWSSVAISKFPKSFVATRISTGPHWPPMCEQNFVLHIWINIFLVQIYTQNIWTLPPNIKHIKGCWNPMWIVTAWIQWPVGPQRSYLLTTLNIPSQILHQFSQVAARHLA